MKPKSSSDDPSTVSIRRQDDIPTVAMPGAKHPKAGGETELDLIHSYWRSGLPALKRQAISRYAQLKGVSPQDAEAALTAAAK
jgi:hypothetical protein